MTLSVYCKYCGESASNERVLLNRWCPKHPSGQNKGKHALYEGEKRASMYVSIAARNTTR